jgi:hypothetical protein
MNPFWAELRSAVARDAPAFTTRPRYRHHRRLRGRERLLLAMCMLTTVLLMTAFCAAISALHVWWGVFFTVPFCMLSVAAFGAMVREIWR